MVDRVVVGGGLSGIVAALEAAEAGERVVLLESQAQLGGAIASAEIDGVEVDAGAESFSIVSPEMIELVDRWGAASQRVQPANYPAHLVLPDRTIAIPRGVMGIPAGADALRGCGVLSPLELRDALDRDRKPWQEDPTASVADIVRARLGELVYGRLVAPILTGVWGVDGQQLSAATVFPELLAIAAREGSLLEGARILRSDQPSMGQAVQSLRGGLHTLIPLLARVLDDAGVQVELTSPVTDIRRADGSWNIRSNHTWDAPRLTIAVGPRALEKLLSGVDGLLKGPELPLEPIPSLVMIASIEAPHLDFAPVGTGALVHQKASEQVKALTHVNAKWSWWSDVLPAHRHLVRLSLRDTSLSDDDAGRVAISVLDEMLQVRPGQVRELALRRWDDVLVQPLAEAAEDVVLLRQRAAVQGLELLGSALPGAGLLRLARHAHYRRQQEDTRVAIG